MRTKKYQFKINFPRSASKFVETVSKMINNAMMATIKMAMVVTANVNYNKDGAVKMDLQHLALALK